MPLLGNNNYFQYDQFISNRKYYDTFVNPEDIDDPVSNPVDDPVSNPVDEPVSNPDTSTNHTRPTNSTRRHNHSGIDHIHHDSEYAHDYHTGKYYDDMYADRNILVVSDRENTMTPSGNKTSYSIFNTTNLMMLGLLGLIIILFIYTYKKK